MKSKKIKTIVITALTGCMLLAVTVSASASGASGYETYKSAVRELVTTRNATFSTSFEVKDNGNTDISGNSVEKLEGTNSSSNIEVKIGDVTKDTETSRVDGKIVIKEGDNYYSMGNSAKGNIGRGNRKIDASSSRAKLGEMVLDTLVGDVKNQFVVDGDEISVKLEGAQIPELAKLAISAAVEEQNDKKSYNKGEFANDELRKAISDIPTLKNVDIKSLSLTAKVDGNTLSENDVKVVITGEDEKGVSHEFELSVNTAVSNVNSTKADSIDTTGKQVQTMENKRSK
ncbi:hypothetical protein D2A34_08655 [Clostridium chromiireducens]|uniref:Uncharacterized protein n=1 Tax=Clostridium chromiireducens TaxID=225345 RepID=A0A399IRQ3_9CLOT|nr:hypothetical protein [Clostridium chromiireducens]RII35267.1 hypothetical protein D2A34_08655 [Clostridium chromiireducens]